MPRPENVIGKGNRFSSTNQPANRGRKPKLYTIAKNTYRISYEEFREVVVHLMQLTAEELKIVVADKETPVWVINIAHALQKDTGKGVINTMRELMDRTWGKVPQRLIGESDNSSSTQLPRSEFLSYRPDPTTLPPISQEGEDNE